MVQLLQILLCLRTNKESSFSSENGLNKARLTRNQKVWTNVLVE